MPHRRHYRQQRGDKKAEGLGISAPPELLPRFGLGGSRSSSIEPHAGLDVGEFERCPADHHLRTGFIREEQPSLQQCAIREPNLDIVIEWKSHALSRLYHSLASLLLPDLIPLFAVAGAVQREFNLL